MPVTTLYGINDNSIRDVFPLQPAVPQFSPKLFIRAEKSYDEELRLNTENIPSVLGFETLNSRGKFYNHQSHLLKELMSVVGTFTIETIFPNKETSNKGYLNIGVDIVGNSDVPNYLRNSDGSLIPDVVGYKTDPDNPTIVGVKYKFVRLSNDVTEPIAGTMTDNDGNPSTIYPLFKFTAGGYGEAYENIGVQLYQDLTTFAEANYAQGGFVTYNLGLVDRSLPVNNTIKTLSGAPSLEFALKPITNDVSLDTNLNMEETLVETYFNVDDPFKLLVPIKIEAPEVNYGNIETVLGIMKSTLDQYITDEVKTWEDGQTASTASWYNIEVDDNGIKDEELYKIDLLGNGLMLINPIMYPGIVKDTEASTLDNVKVIELGANNVAYLADATPMDLTDEAYNEEVKKQLSRYYDADDIVNDELLSAENAIIDSGWPIDVKETMGAFITHRKVGIIIAGTYVFNENNILPAEDTYRQMGLALKSIYSMAPESTYYGTKTARAIIMVGAGKTSETPWRYYVPTTFEMAYKLGAFAGSNSRKWNRDNKFTYGKGSLVSRMKNIVPKYFGKTARAVLSDIGLTWLQKVNVGYQIQSPTSIYDNETSVVKQIPVLIAAGTLQRVALESWVETVGADDMRDNDFKVFVINNIQSKIKDLFAGIVEVTVDVVITDRDRLLGNSYEVVYGLYANNAKENMRVTVDARRMSELQQ